MVTYSKDEGMQIRRNMLVIKIPEPYFTQPINPINLAAEDSRTLLQSPCLNKEHILSA